MSTQHPAQTPADGSNVELSVTSARAGVRRGVSKILVISTVLVVIALAGAWALVLGPHQPSHPSEATPPAASQPQ